MPARSLALLFLVLIVLPWTAPFSTCHLVPDRPVTTLRASADDDDIDTVRAAERVDFQRQARACALVICAPGNLIARPTGHPLIVSSVFVTVAAPVGVTVLRL